jgi:hypothetical protein
LPNNPPTVRGCCTHTARNKQAAASGLLVLGDPEPAGIAATTGGSTHHSSTGERLACLYLALPFLQFLPQPAPAPADAQQVRAKAAACWAPAGSSHPITNPKDPEGTEAIADPEDAGQALSAPGIAAGGPGAEQAQASASEVLWLGVLGRLAAVIANAAKPVLRRSFPHAGCKCDIVAAMVVSKPGGA